MRGGEKCLEVLCRRFPDARLYTLVHVAGKTSPAIERMDIRTSFLQSIPLAERHYRWMLPLMPTAIERLEIPDDVDLVLSFSHAVAKSIRVPEGVPHVCYCFTPMRYAWHMREDYIAPRGEPQGSGAVVLSGRMMRAPLNAAKRLVLDSIREWDRKTSDRVTHFVAISNTIARRIEEAYGRPSRIIYPPVDTEYYTPDDSPRRDFYLCVSALVPYKRIDLAVAACERMGRRLIVIGSGPESQSLRGRAGPMTTFLGWQSDEQIREHLRRCRALLFPGHEDFGIVPVEAQACGAPVIAFNRGGATETILPSTADQPGSGRFFERQTVDSLVEAMAWVESNPAQLPSSLARTNSLRFTAARYESELLDYLEEVARRQSSTRPVQPQRNAA
jgi:glycosyltransferase involved in cell wall biosynthesis